MLYDPEELTVVQAESTMPLTQELDEPFPRATGAHLLLTRVIAFS